MTVSSTPSLRVWPGVKRSCSLTVSNPIKCSPFGSSGQCHRALPVTSLVKQASALSGVCSVPFRSSAVTTLPLSSSILPASIKTLGRPRLSERRNSTFAVSCLQTGAPWAPRGAVLGENGRLLVAVIQVPSCECVNVASASSVSDQQAPCLALRTVASSSSLSTLVKLCVINNPAPSTKPCSLGAPSVSSC